MEASAEIGSNTIINVKNIDIHSSSVIGDNVFIECETFKIGKHCKIGDNVKITCKTFISDDWLYMASDVEVGRGGCHGPKSNIKIGKHVGIFENTILNPSDEIEIGDNVGIGCDVMIWTHGAWLDITQGFPSDFGPVKIGDNVWLPARSIVLPNVTIGDNTVIGIGSIINRSIPSGCFAAGSPCKVITEACYPRKLSDDETSKIICEILEDWCKLHNIKDISAEVEYSNGCITLRQKINKTIFDINKRTIIGYNNDVVEDLRDYLRRRGIKIFTNKPFKSIKPNFL